MVLALLPWSSGSLRLGRAETSAVPQPKRGPGRAQMLMGNLSECKQAMLEYEMDTLTLGMEGMDT